VIKGLIFDIRRFTIHDGPGIRTTVFFKGCPLSCWWCHNPESQDFKSEQSIRNLVLEGKKFRHTETTGQFMTVGEVMAEVEKDRVFYEESGGGVTFSGGEPMMQEPFLYALLQASKAQGLHTTLDTSGYASLKAMQHIAPLVDLFLYDLKIIDDDLHRKFTGVSNKIILENLRSIVDSGKQVFLRFPVVPGITDTPENIRQVKFFITTLSHQHITTLNLLPYHSIAKEKYRRFCKSNQMAEVQDLRREDILPLKNEFEQIGLQVFIGG
jgi:pyruvate formate lyase activating enzyme